MATEQHLLRLLQIASPQFPVGAYAYSQGLEWAVHAGAVRDEHTAGDWILGLLEHALAATDVPLLQRLYRAACANDPAALAYWNRFYVAMRESAELRAETRQLGRACAQALIALEIKAAQAWVEAEDVNFVGMFALAAAHWQISIEDAVHAYLWAWCENQVASAMKLVPLGQTAGQRLLNRAITVIPSAVRRGLVIADDDIGFFAPHFAIASARHETQYTRLFRS